MPLEPIRFIKNWLRNTTTREQNWDEIADKTSAFASRTNNNLKQIGLDINGSTYDFNNNGIATQSRSIISRLDAVESVQGPIGSRNIGLNLATAGTVILTQQDGSTLTAASPGLITLNSTSDPGELIEREITGPMSLTLTGAHWGFGTLGDLTDKKLWLLLIDTGSTIIFGIDAKGGRTTVTAADAEPIAANVTTIDKVLVTSEPGGTYNCYYIGWVNADFDDTGNAGGEDFWTVQTSAGDVNLGRGENVSRNQTLEGDNTIGGNLSVGGSATINGNSTLGNASTDRITPNGTFDISFHHGAKTPGWISNLGISYSAGVFKITDAAGNDLSTTNYGWVCVPSTTPGRTVTLKVTYSATFQDDAHASSNLTGMDLGITNTVHWASDMPFFLYVINRGNSNIDGVDGSSVFAFSRLPWIKETDSLVGSTTIDVGGHSGGEVRSLYIIQDVTLANYTSLPVQVVGCFRMRYSFVTTDWTVQTLSNFYYDGVGLSKVHSFLSNTWSFPVGQNNDSGTTYFFNNTGTPPLFSTQEYFYKLTMGGDVLTYVYFAGDGGQDGVGAANARLAVPINILHPTTVGVYQTSGYVLSATTLTSETALLTGASNVLTDYFYALYYLNVTGVLCRMSAVNLNMFTAGNRVINLQRSYNAKTYY